MNSATTLVDRAVECVASKLLDLSQRDPSEFNADDLPTTPPPVEKADSLHVIELRKNKKSQRRRKLSKVLQSKKSSNRQLLNEVISGQKGTESARELFANPVLKKQFIRRYMVQSLSMNDKVRFDSIAATTNNGKIVMMDSKGFSKGCYEWSIEILKSDVELQGILPLSFSIFFIFIRFCCLWFWGMTSLTLSRDTVRTEIVNEISDEFTF